MKILVFDIFEKGQILRTFSGLPPSKLIIFSTKINASIWAYRVFNLPIFRRIEGGGGKTITITKYSRFVYLYFLLCIHLKIVVLVFLDKYNSSVKIKLGTYLWIQITAINIGVVLYYQANTYIVKQQLSYLDISPGHDWTYNIIKYCFGSRLLP